MGHLKTFQVSHFKTRLIDQAVDGAIHVATNTNDISFQSDRGVSGSVRITPVQGVRTIAATQFPLPGAWILTALPPSIFASLVH